MCLTEFDSSTTSHAFCWFPEWLPTSLGELMIQSKADHHYRTVYCIYLWFIRLSLSVWSKQSWVKQGWPSVLCSLLHLCLIHNTFTECMIQARLSGDIVQGANTPPPTVTTVVPPNTTGNTTNNVTPDRARPPPPPAGGTSTTTTVTNTTTTTTITTVCFTLASVLESLSAKYACSQNLSHRTLSYWRDLC